VDETLEALTIKEYEMDQVCVDRPGLQGDVCSFASFFAITRIPSCDAERQTNQAQWQGGRSVATDNESAKSCWVATGVNAEPRLTVA
jgi:hypothetical protein